MTLPVVVGRDPAGSCGHCHAPAYDHGYPIHATCEWGVMCLACFHWITYSGPTEWAPERAATAFNGPRSRPPS